MANHSSATVRAETPHASQTTHISKAVRRRAEAIVNDRTIDAESRALIRFALEINDPMVAELVRRADAGERLSDTLDFQQSGDEDSSRNIVEVLTEIICCAGGEKASAALLVLMSMVQNSSDPQALANTAKHLAFTRCGELNVNGMVDAQAAVFKNEFFAGNMSVS